MRFTPVRKLKIKEGTVPKGGRQPVQLPIHMAPIQKYTNGKKNEVKAVQQSAKPARTVTKPSHSKVQNNETVEESWSNSFHILNKKTS